MNARRIRGLVLSAFPVRHFFRRFLPRKGRFHPNDGREKTAMMTFLIEHGKYLAVLLGILTGYPIVWQHRDRLMVKKPSQAVLICIIFSTFSVISAMLFATLESLVSGGGLNFGAISTYGIYFLCPPILILLAWARKEDARNWLDVYTLYAMPSLFLLRCNCLLAGCCGGRMIPGTSLRWPVRQAEMVFYVVMLLVLLRREKRAAASGTGFPLLMVVYGIFRFVEEWFRSGSGDSLIHLAHVWSLVSIVIGLGFYYELKNHGKKTTGTHGERRAKKC